MTKRPFCGLAESRAAPLHLVTAVMSSGPSEDVKRLSLWQETPSWRLFAQGRQQKGTFVGKQAAALVLGSAARRLNLNSLPASTLSEISRNSLRRLVGKQIHFISWSITFCLQLFTSSHHLSGFCSILSFTRGLFAPSIKQFFF